MENGGLTLARYLLHITGTFVSVFKYFCGRYHKEKNGLTLILFERTEVVLQLGVLKKSQTRFPQSPLSNTYK